MTEHDAMICRACAQEERASEGYPCEGCGTFLCVLCSMKGVHLCQECAAKAVPGAARPNA